MTKTSPARAKGRQQAAAAKSAHKELVGRNLAAARVAVGLSQPQFARLYGLSSGSAVANWEAGTYYPDPWVLVRFCGDYGFTTDWFYRDIRAGVSAERADDLRRVERETSEG